MSGFFTLVTGGARSGKSSFAEQLAQRSSKDVYYIATSQIKDTEMEHRAAIHRQRRPDDWTTIEEPFNIAECLEKFDSPRRLFLIDCITVWLSNILLQFDLPTDVEQLILPASAEKNIVERVSNLAEKAARTMADVIMVTNEVGWGVVPAAPLGRLYRDYAGKVNQELAKKADHVFLVACGQPLQLKGREEK